MKTWNFILLILVLSACNLRVKNQNEKTQSENADGISLFDGKTLEGWEIPVFGAEGQVSVSEGKIVLGFGDGCTGVTWTKDFPKVNYVVSLEAMKISGNDFFCGMTFPVNETFCSLVVGGWGGAVVGLSTIDGTDAANNETKILKKFEHNTWYKIRLRVTAEKIEAWIDEKKVVDFTIGEHELYIRPEVTLSKPFGIASWTTTAALRNIRLEEL